MKKIIFSLLAIVATMNAMAAMSFTAKAKLTLTTTTESCDMYLVQSDELPTGINAYCEEMNMEFRQIAFYAIDGTTPYQTYAVKTLGALPFGLKTDAATDYTLTITQVGGAETLKIKDEVTGTVFDLTEGYVYNFTADANQAAITNRFHLFVVPSTPEICHRYGRLQVTGMKNSNVVVKNMDDSATTIGTVAITDDYQEITLKGVLDAGQYKVEYNDGTAHTVIIKVQ